MINHVSESISKILVMRHSLTKRRIDEFNEIEMFNNVDFLDVSLGCAIPSTFTPGSNANTDIPEIISTETPTNITNSATSLTVSTNSDLDIDPHLDVRPDTMSTVILDTESESFINKYAGIENDVNLNVNLENDLNNIDLLKNKKQNNDIHIFDGTTLIDNSICTRANPKQLNEEIESSSENEQNEKSKYSKRLPKKITIILTRWYVFIITILFTLFFLRY